MSSKLPIGLKANVILAACIILYSLSLLASPGAIPLDHSLPPATDILFNNQLQTADQLTKLRSSGLDLSELNPRNDTELWRDENPLPLSEESDRLSLKVASEVEYISNVVSSTGNFRFSVRQNDENDQNQIFSIWVSKTSHSILLRKNILRKLGYRVPPTVYLPKLKVKFRGAASLKAFVNDLKYSTLGDPKRWIITEMDDNTRIIEIQDVLAFSAVEPFYNLANGYMSSELINGRRLLNSLIVPYSIVNAQESVNGMSWLPGRVFNGQVLLTVDNSQAFSTPLEDAQWILKRIARLSRQDFFEIVKMSHYPEDVAALLVEKIISRRNWLYKNLNLKNTPDLPFNDLISQGPDLVNGELKKERWEGHGSRYSYTDPKSPISSSEIGAFFKSKITSTALEALVVQFDNALLHGTNIERKIYEKQFKAAQKAFVDTLKTGKVQKVPFGLFPFPTFDIDVWASRDIIIGDYLGSENMIQLADTFETSLKPGVFISAVGLPAQTSFQAGAQLRLSRSYTHLRSIKSMKKALKEPFKNILVQKLKTENGRILDALLADDFRKLKLDDPNEREEKEKKLTEIMTAFNEAMATGDSYIISDNIGQDVFASIAYGLTSHLTAQANMYNTRRSFGRLHILKRSDTELQIYRDDGDINIRGFRFGLKAKVPILSIEFNKANGSNHTVFYTLDLSPNYKANPDIESTLHGMRQLFIENSMELIKVNTKPYIVDHTFTEKVRASNFFFAKYFGHRSTDLIRIQHPKGQIKSFLRATDGEREGNDFQGLTVDIINAILADRLGNEDVTIPNPGSGNPGDTFKGKSTSRNAVFELEIVKDGSDEKAVRPFVNIAYRWKGWELSPRNMFELLDQINFKFNFEMFTKLDMQRAENFQLYAVDVNLYVYENAIENLLKLPDETIRTVIRNLADITLHPYYSQGASEAQYESDNQFREQIISELLKQRNRYLDLNNRGDKKSALEHGLNYLSTLELVLPFHTFVDLAGGPDKLFVFARASAFRESDENGDLPFTGNTFGQIDSDQPRGALVQSQSTMGISFSSLYLTWLLRGL